MFRSFLLALLALAFTSTAFAADSPDTPEKLLPPTTQLFVRWDGIAAHKEAYKKSIWGGVMAGPTGESIREMIANGSKLLGSTVLADPLLEGKPFLELKSCLADFKATEKFVDLIADRGLLLAVEVREPAPTIRGVARAIGGLFGGKLPGAEIITPDAQMILIVPHVGDKAEVLFGSLRTIVRATESKLEPFQIDGRKGFSLNPDSEDKKSTHVAWWIEGQHFVFYVGSRKPSLVISEMHTHAKTVNLTSHPLFQRCCKPGKFEAVTRGFVDTARMVTLTKDLAGPFVPGLKERFDSNGVSGLKAIVFTSGFDGKDSRALWEFDVPGERKGLAKALVNKPLGLNDLPPMPPDVVRFSALRLDPTATYDALVSFVETLRAEEAFGVEEGVQQTAAMIKARKEYLLRQADNVLGICMKEDLLPYLGDKVVVFQSPNEGFQFLGTVICISVKDPEKVKTATARLHEAMKVLTGSPVKVRKKMLRGVEIREFHSAGFGFVTPTCSVVDNWLVIAAYPQPVQGFVLRAKSNLKRWQPDDATTKRIAKLPADACGLQYCSPKSTVDTLCSLGPLFFSVLNAVAGRGEDMDSDPDLIDVSLVPNAHELNQHLFPNLTVTRDNGKTISVEVNESFSLPMEFIGIEPFGFAITLGLGFALPLN